MICATGVSDLCKAIGTIGYRSGRSRHLDFRHFGLAKVVADHIARGGLLLLTIWHILLVVLVGSFLVYEATEHVWALLVAKRLVRLDVLPLGDRVAIIGLRCSPVSTTVKIEGALRVVGFWFRGGAWRVAGVSNGERGESASGQRGE